MAAAVLPTALVGRGSYGPTGIGCVEVPRPVLVLANIVIAGYLNVLYAAIRESIGTSM
jgi:hypothetical protein